MITVEIIKEVMDAHWRRCEMAAFVGGIPLWKVVDTGKKPEGYWFDSLTEYYIPPNVDAGALDGPTHRQ